MRISDRHKGSSFTVIICSLLREPVGGYAMHGGRRVTTCRCKPPYPVDAGTAGRCATSLASGARRSSLYVSRRGRASYRSSCAWRGSGPSAD
eukprot:30320-Eustigmatos_ZCMA.PRE.1